MTTVTPIGSSSQQVEYRLGRQHDCQVDYHADQRERPLRWIGGGLSDVGIVDGAEFTEGDLERARALMQGLDPRTGEVLVEAKTAVFDDAKVSLAPLVAAIREEAQHRGLSPESMLPSSAVSGWVSATRAVDRLGPLALRRADEAGRLADAAGLDPADIWGAEAFQSAVGNLSELAFEEQPDGSQVPVVRPRRKQVGNRGYDITFTLPKSYSLLLALSDDSVSERCEALYGRQIRRAFTWLESQTAYQMQGKHGAGHTATIVPSSGFLGWSMVHRSARPVDGAPIGDPHWHVHVSIANMCHDPESDKWQTVAAGGRDLMRHAPTIDHVTKALIRHELSVELGVRWRRSERTGAWEVADISDETLLAFSKRGVAIRDVLAELGMSSATASARAERIAEATSRGEKTESVAAEDAALRRYWLAEADAQGLKVRDELAASFASAEACPQEVSRSDILHMLTDPEQGLTSHSRRFSRLQAVAAVADALPQGVQDVAQLEALTDDLLSEPCFKSVVSASVRGQESPDRGSKHMANVELWTTSDVVSVETIIAQCSKLRFERRHPIDPLRTAEAIHAVEELQGYDLSDEQQNIVNRLLSSRSAVETVVGPPGTGKTTLLRAARAGWEINGLTVRGAATAAVAAQNLERESGISSDTLAGIITKARHQANPLAGVDVLVLDEANLTDDRSRARLYELAREGRTQIIEVGDPKQLRGVGCGSMFKTLHEMQPASSRLELHHNRRQRDAADRAALDAWRARQEHSVIADWGERGQLIATETRAETVAHMIARWQEERAGAPNPELANAGVLMLAATNESVALLNQAAQWVRAEAGEVTELHTFPLASGDHLTLGVGDVAMVRVNSRGERLHRGDDVVNGVRGRITEVTDGTVRLEWLDPRTDERRRGLFDTEFIARGGLQLGYALTTHKAEGVTVSANWTKPDGEQQYGTVLVDLTGMDNAAMYVSTSRHKGSMVAYAPRQLVESVTTAANEGVPTTRDERGRRVQQAIATTAVTTRDNPDDQPVVSPGTREPQREQSLADRLRQERRDARERARRTAVLDSAAEAPVVEDNTPALPQRTPERGIER